LDKEAVLRGLPRCGTAALGFTPPVVSFSVIFVFDLGPVLVACAVAFTLGDLAAPLGVAGTLVFRVPADDGAIAVEPGVFSFAVSDTGTLAALVSLARRPVPRTLLDPPRPPRLPAPAPPRDRLRAAVAAFAGVPPDGVSRPAGVAASAMSTVLADVRGPPAQSPASTPLALRASQLVVR
ncbi:hypothetical protein THASP1DRAFT_26388, partial [Thamnocephalis sphaerospora]